MLNVETEVFPVSKLGLSHPLRQLFVPIGELSCFGSFGIFLTSSCSCSHFHIDLSALRMHACARCICMVPGPVWLLWARFWGLLMRFDLFSGLLQSLTTLCACVHAFHASVQFSSPSGSPMRDTAPLAGKSEVADGFAAVHESFAMLHTCTHAPGASV